jgi:phage anti-repressor protein/very-short-patch-repair endonuclease
MDKLIQLESKQFNNNVKQTVNARELHKSLESKQDYSTWVKKYLEDFTENQDYIRLHKKRKGNNATLKEYFLTIPVAISCIQKTYAPIELKRQLLQALDDYTILNTRAEIEFFDTLEKILEPLDIKGQRQHKVLNYNIDYYIKDLNIAIEYDEGHHKNQQEEDVKREQDIINEISCEFVRVRQEDGMLWNCGYVVKALLGYVIKKLLNK